MDFPEPTRILEQSSLYFETKDAKLLYCLIDLICFKESSRIRSQPASVQSSEGNNLIINTTDSTRSIFAALTIPHSRVSGTVVAPTQIGAMSTQLERDPNAILQAFRRTDSFRVFHLDLLSIHNILEISEKKWDQLQTQRHLTFAYLPSESRLFLSLAQLASSHHQTTQQPTMEVSAAVQAIQAHIQPHPQQPETARISVTRPAPFYSALKRVLDANGSVVEVGIELDEGGFRPYFASRSTTQTVRCELPSTSTQLGSWCDISGSRITERVKWSYEHKAMRCVLNALDRCSAVQWRVGSHGLLSVIVRVSASSYFMTGQPGQEHDATGFVEFRILPKDELWV
eukprot:gnl/Dysnectes_brevis/5306_a7566_452.p1 GENE.gnl/Dysnectes_brevis/5306_a7566_452~~gnl/Dysnectes_brevis/5306_a7566_452.p1  ORF type:complete len:342 (+),score=57.25 gnl/Dysnectes_brevis/5306_a7566_452:58-1083(+)